MAPRWRGGLGEEGGKTNINLFLGSITGGRISNNSYILLFYLKLIWEFIN
jgi:hypothetical protein